MASPISANDICSAPRNTGVSNPFSVATAMAISALAKWCTSVPCTWMLTPGTSTNASATARTR